MNAAAPPCVEPWPWRRGLLWLALLGPLFFASYGFSNWLAAQRSEVATVVFGWERQIPFLSWSIVPYWSIDLFYGISLLLPRSRSELDAHAKRLLTAQLLSVACFIAFPLRFSFERPASGGVPGWLFDVLLGFDKPFNQAPSLHISLLVILWTLYARYLRGAWLWLLRAVAVAIGLSVLTTYQHHFIDIPTGALAGCLAVWLFPLQPQPALRQHDPQRLVMAGYYAAGALSAAVFAALLRGGWLWLLWPACALAAVAGIYLRGDPLLFRKRDGRMEEALAVLLAPYLIAAWLNSRLWTYRHPQPSTVLPGLWLSRRPSAAVLRKLKPSALVDCCAELPAPAGSATLYQVPLLDLLLPECEQIEQGVAALDAAHRQGDTLVYCALGYSRSALIVSAWLAASGHAADIAAAVATVRRARPELVLSPRHLARLEAWYEQRN